MSKNYFMKYKPRMLWLEQGSSVRIFHTFFLMIKDIMVSLIKNKKNQLSHINCNYLI